MRLRVTQRSTAAIAPGYLSFSAFAPAPPRPRPVPVPPAIICIITSDGSVVERAADLGITYFDTARGYQQGNNERMVGAALKNKRTDVTLATKTHAGSKAEAPGGRPPRLLEQVPEELVVNFVVVLHLRRLHEGAELARATIG